MPSQSGRREPPPFHPSPAPDRQAAVDSHRAAVRDFAARALPPAKAAKAHRLAQREADRRTRHAPAQARIWARVAVILDPRVPSPPSAGPVRRLVRGGQGTGKSLAATDLLAEAGGLLSLLLVPTHARATEAAAELRRAIAGRRDAPAVMEMRGMGADRPDGGGTMCALAPAAEAVHARGEATSAVLCPRCPYRAGCPYLAQRADLSRHAARRRGVVVIATHPWAFMPLPGGAEPDLVVPDLVVVDEALPAHGTERATLPLSALRDRRRVADRGGAGPGDAEAPPDLAGDALAAVADAFERAPAAPIAALRRTGWTAERMEGAARALGARRPGGTRRAIEAAYAEAGAGADPAALGHRIACALGDGGAALASHRALILRAVARDLESGAKAGVGAVAATYAQRGPTGSWEALPAVSGHVMRPLAGIPPTAHLLVLDGTADPEVAALTFGPLEVAGERVDRRARVIQCIGRRWSKRSLTGAGGGREAAAEAARLRGELIPFLGTRPKALVVAPKAVLDALGADGWRGRGAHFGALRGLNAYADAAEVIVIGREEPWREAEGIGRALAAAAGAATFAPLAGPPGTVRRGLRMRDGSRVGVDVPVHPDPWAQRALEAMREAEVVRAVDRLRPHFRPDVIRVTILAELALDLAVDAVTRWADLRDGGTRPARALARAGLLPLRATDAMAVAPGVWPSMRSAERDLAEVAKGLSRHFPKKASKGVGGIAINPLILCEYRTAPKCGRAGKVARLVIAGPCADPRAKAEAALGPLAHFEVLGEAGREGPEGPPVRPPECTPFPTVPMPKPRPAPAGPAQRPRSIMREPQAKERRPCPSSKAAPAAPSASPRTAGSASPSTG